MKLTLKNGKLYDVDGREVGKILRLELELTAPPAELDDPQLRIAGGSQDVVLAIWRHYVQLMAPRTTALDDQTRSLIRQALKVATASECKDAINGCHASDYHMRRGEYGNRPGPKYNKISHVLKGKRGGRTTREQIDFFLDIAQRRATTGALPSADPVRIRDAKNDVLAAHEFAGDEHVAQRGSEARRWLQEQGWVIGTRENDDWPTFQPPTA